MSETTTHRNIIYRLLPGPCRFVSNAVLARHNDAHEAAKANGEKLP